PVQRAPVVVDLRQEVGEERLDGRLVPLGVHHLELHAERVLVVRRHGEHLVGRRVILSRSCVCASRSRSFMRPAASFAFATSNLPAMILSTTASSPTSGLPCHATLPCR